MICTTTVHFLLWRRLLKLRSWTHTWDMVVLAWCPRMPRVALPQWWKAGGVCLYRPAPCRCAEEWRPAWQWIPLRARCLNLGPAAFLVFPFTFAGFCFCSSFYNALSLIPTIIWGNWNRQVDLLLAGHRSGCLPRFWLWLSWREWGRGSERHSAAPHKQTSTSG